MYCMTVEYPRQEGSRFDLDYYREQHLPLCEQLLAGRGFLGSVLRIGAGGAPGKSDQQWASVDLLFESAEQLGAALAAVGQDIGADVPNYTDVQPRMTFAEASVALA
jgi:uncharacterized protein (TIGR02118 family)